MSIKILFIGEIVGKAGVFCVKSLLPKLKKEHAVDFVIANGDSTTGGFGIGKNHSIYLHKLGVDLITGGECVYYKKDMVPYIQKAPFILRPANYPPGNPGRGWKIVEINGHKLGVVNLLGQSGFDRVHVSNPFTFLPEIVKRIQVETETIIVDYHASTTAEKKSMLFFARDKVSAVLGTHYKIQTTDAEVTADGMAYITDVGRTGSQDSVNGLEPEIEITKFLTQIPERSKTAWANLELQGVVLEINDNHKAVSIVPLKVPCEMDKDLEEKQLETARFGNGNNR